MASFGTVGSVKNASFPVSQATTESATTLRSGSAPSQQRESNITTIGTRGPFPSVVPDIQQGGNVLMISTQRIRPFYERAARELLASGHETVRLSALGNAVPSAIQVALSLCDKEAVVLKKIETKHVRLGARGTVQDATIYGSLDGARLGRGRNGIRGSASGVIIDLARHPDFKGTRIVPTHIFFLPKIVDATAKAFPRMPDINFATVHIGTHGTPLSIVSSNDHLLQALEAAKIDPTSLESVHEHLFNEARKVNRDVTSVDSIRFIGDIATVRNLTRGSLEAAFARILPVRAEQKDTTGCVFVHLFDAKKPHPHNSPLNAGLVHVVVPRFDGESAWYLEALELTAFNFMTGLCDYNGYVRRVSDTMRFTRLEVVRLPDLSCLASPVCKIASCVTAFIKGLDKAYHFGTSPRIQFTNDADCITEQTWKHFSGVESIQVTEEQFRRMGGGPAETRQSLPA